MRWKVLKKVNISHNLDDVELEEVLEKALKGVRKKMNDPEAPLDDELSEKIREESFKLFEKVSSNMIKEIKKVIKK